MNAMDIDDIDDDMPFELIEHAKAAALEILSMKSREKYFRVYKNFTDWKMSHGVSKMSSNLIMAYFHMLEEKKYKPITLWSVYSMLKATLRAKEDIDIVKYTQVVAFLKRKSSGFKSIKAEVFTEAGVKKFIEEAEDLSWLDVKVSTNSKEILLLLQFFIQFDLGGLYLRDMWCMSDRRIRSNYYGRH